MKKIFLIILMSLTLSANLYAEEGTIKSITISATETVIVLTLTGGGEAYSPISSAVTGDFYKSFLAAAMTAKSTNSLVTLNWNNGWDIIRLD